MPPRRSKEHVASANETSDGRSSQRLDRWLWFARVTKSRSLAAALILGGKVRVNKVRVIKPSHTIKIDDVVTIAVHRHVRVLKMLDPGVRRGPAPQAQLLYDDLTPPPEPHETAAGTAEGADGQSGGASLQAGPPSREPGSGRPTKRERRTLDRLRGDGHID